MCKGRFTEEQMVPGASAVLFQPSNPICAFPVDELSSGELRARRHSRR